MFYSLQKLPASTDALSRTFPWSLTHFTHAGRWTTKSGHRAGVCTILTREASLSVIPWLWSTSHGVKALCQACHQVSFNTGTKWDPLYVRPRWCWSDENKLFIASGTKPGDCSLQRHHLTMFILLKMFAIKKIPLNYLRYNFGNRSAHPSYELPLQLNMEIARQPYQAHPIVL